TSEQVPSPLAAVSPFGAVVHMRLYNGATSPSSATDRKRQPETCLESCQEQWRDALTLGLSLVETSI
ncbi:unnamed protein product, partial [Lampetra planeri]